jgi:hypothetical protein
MMYKVKVTVCSQIRIKRSTQSEHRVEYSMLNLVVCNETARLLKVKVPSRHSPIGTDESAENTHSQLLQPKIDPDTSRRTSPQKHYRFSQTTPFLCPTILKVL